MPKYSKTLKDIIKEAEDNIKKVDNQLQGRENDAQKGELIFQPSPYDVGTIIDTIAEFDFGIETKFTDFTCPVRNALSKIYKDLFGIVKTKIGRAHF